MKKLSCLESYRVMLQCFRLICLQTQDDRLGSLLSSAALYSANKNESPETMDPAVWHDWMDGIKIVVNDHTATYNSVELTVEQGYAAARQYFIIYCDIGFFESIGILRDLLGADSNNLELARWLRNKWNQALLVVLQEDLPEKIGHFLAGGTELSERESFVVMKIFLDDWCQQNSNELLIQLLQNCRLRHRDNFWNLIPDIIEPKIWQLWKDAIEEILKQQLSCVLTIEVAYKAMPIFLTKVFNQNVDSETLYLIQAFDVEGQERLIQRSLGFLWLNAASKANAEQEAVGYDLITINTPIPKNKAQKLIMSWFKLYEHVIDQRLTISSNFEKLQQYKRSYLLLDDEVTVLETYFIMVNFLKSMKQEYSQFDIEEDRPKNFLVLLEWLLLAEKLA